MKFVPNALQIVPDAFVNDDLTRATRHLGLIKRLKDSFSACLFLIDITNENKGRGFLTAPYSHGQKDPEVTTDADPRQAGVLLAFLL